MRRVKAHKYYFYYFRGDIINLRAHKVKDYTFVTCCKCQVTGRGTVGWNWPRRINKWEIISKIIRGFIDKTSYFHNLALEFKCLQY